MGKADIHIHTVHSWDGTCTVEAVLKQAAHVARLDVIAITDHDEIRGGQEALELAPRYGIEVIPGCEISTADGHLLALFIHERIPAGLPLLETVLRVGAQGGVCVAPHPEARMTSSIQRESLFQVLQNETAAHVLCGLEAFNAGLFDRVANRAAVGIARQFSLAEVGASDSHLLWTIGHGRTLFPGRTAQDLREALLARQTVCQAVRNPSNLAVMGGWVRSYLLRRAGWVECNPFPDAPVGLRRVPELAYQGK